MSLSDIDSHDLIDELEYRGFIVVSSTDFNEVINQLKEWENGGKS